MTRIALNNGQYADLIIAAAGNIGGNFPLPNGQYAQTVVPVDTNGTPIVSRVSRQAIGGTNRWYLFTPHVFPSLSAIATVTSSIVFTPIIIERTMTIDSLGINVTIGATSSAPRLGIYDSNSNFEPANLIIDAGIVDAGTVGPKNTSSFNVVLQPGLYWLASIYNISCTVSQYTSSSNAQALYTLGQTGISTSSTTGRTLTATYGSLPATVSGTTFTAAVPAIWTRII